MAAVSQSTQPTRKPPFSNSLSSLHEAAAVQQPPSSTTSSSTAPRSPASGPAHTNTIVPSIAPSGHRHLPSTSSQRSGGFLALAAAALDKTLAGISEPRIRPRQSFSRLSTGPDFLLSASSQQLSPDKPSRSRPASNYAGPSPTLPGDTRHTSSPSPRDDPFARPYTETDPNYPQPVRLSRLDNKMHQTSSRLLRMTDDDRPFTKVSRCLLRFPPSV
jgi:hypothetical protein